MNAPVASAEQPVTVVITRKVKAGREQDYEAWLLGLQSEARRLPGYLGVTTQRPAATGPREYVSAIRFATFADLRAFEGSELRARHLSSVVELVESDAVWERMTGLEFWFSPPAGMVVPQPSRPRMALVMIAVVFVLVLSIGTLVNHAAAMLPVTVPYPLRLLLTITLEVMLMTYWLMPQLTRRLASWIYPRRRAAA